MIEAYVRSLRTALGRRLPPGVLAARLREAEGHLRLSAREFGEVEALRRYGSARAVAKGMVRVHRGYATTSPWRLSLGVGLAFCAAVILPALWMNVLLQQERGVGGADTWYRWGPFLALIAFALRAAQTRRWLVLPALAWIVGAQAMSVAIQLAVPPYATTGKAAQDAYDRTIRFYDSQQAFADAWRRGTPSHDRAPQPRPVTEIATVPMTPIQYEKPLEPAIELGEVRSIIESRRLWDRYGPEWATRIARQRTAAILGKRQRAPSVHWQVVLGIVVRVLAPAIVGSGLALVIVNASALGLATLSDRRYVFF